MNDLYNPCDDGFAAKAWECLRRNEMFIQYFNRESQQSEQHSLPPVPNRFALSALTKAILATPRWERLPRWAELEEHIRKELDWVATSIEGVMEIPLPIAGQSPFSHEDVQFHFGGTGGILVRIPREIQNTAHRKLILLQLDQLVPQTSNKGQWMRPAGGLLGTKRAWTAYLNFKWWEERTGNRTLAIKLAAYVSQKNPDRDITRLMKGEPLCASDLRKLDSYPLNRHHIQAKSYIQGVENSIASVFPEFKPHYMKRRG